MLLLSLIITDLLSLFSLLNQMMKQILLISFHNYIEDKKIHWSSVIRTDKSNQLVLYEFDLALFGSNF